MKHDGDLPPALPKSGQSARAEVPGGVAPPREGCLAISRLTAGYGKRDVLRDVSLHDLRRGEISSLLGPNGSGKSTLLKSVAGLVRPRGGSIHLDDVDLAGLAPARRAHLIAYMPQDMPATVHLRLLESVLVAARAHMGWHGPAPDPQAAQALLDRLDIGHLSLRYLEELSGGERQLAGLALALIREPQVLLLDEPLAALDLRHQIQVMALLARETRARGLITLMAVHDLNIALRHTDRAILMRDGALAAEGTPAEVVRPDTLAAVYGVRALVARCDRGLPYVLIDDVLAPAPRS